MLDAVPTKARGGRGKRGGISELARITGKSRDTIASKIATAQAVQIETKVTPEAKEAAREAGLIDNNSAMLAVASVAPEEQTAKIEEIIEQQFEGFKAASPSRSRSCKKGRGRGSSGCQG
jgi:hypothetical protein